jgi:D-alanyl-lipoteichoic acid acyltransferase DltB (MBOAT superfamily)
MFQEISFYSIGGIPFIVHLGIIAFLLFVITALIALLRKKGKTKISVKWHFWLAYLALLLGGIHLVLGIFSYI